MAAAAAVRASIGTIAAALVLALAAPPAAAYQAKGIRIDPIVLNIGLVCQWQMECMNRQDEAMRKSLKYIAKYRPPEWRIQQCNRNSSRGGQRKDWAGFDRCVRNAALRYVPPPPPPSPPKRRKRR